MIRKTQEEKQDRTEGSDIDVRPSKADPFFLSDGITEQYISRSYSYPTTDPASTSISGLEDDSTIAGSTAPITLTLNPDLRFAANAEGPNLIIRLSSWCDEMSLSAEWREMDYDDGQVLDFLEDVKGVMMLLLLLE
ncbi:hypothetical protein PVAG01_07904 [Phlyctema vagabunda]|uniref:Uncharacterized protein n=1 Tax=Phlyctema vagabunda TaxID=108571 RepID=A0ABR4PDR0_9HELO